MNPEISIEKDNFIYWMGRRMVEGLVKLRILMEPSSTTLVSGQTRFVHWRMQLSYKRSFILALRTRLF